MTDSPVLEVFDLGFPWRTFDPFLFCVHHLDEFPVGNEQMGPDPSLLRGRRMGMDFEIRDGWRMYHGEVVPGFPAHPHRGFETITVARQGFIDHSDSLGAKARFGRGDVQWMTAGRGVVHSEMFPLLSKDEPNTGELFQIWLNLPKERKMARPHFAMFWSEDIPVVVNDGVEVTVIAGGYGGASPLAPPPDSWASREHADVAVWSARIAPGATWTLPTTRETTVRAVYLVDGDGVRVGDVEVTPGRGARVRADLALDVTAGPSGADVLVLQGQPINEPIAQHGPFVMNHPGEIRQAMIDYQQTRFGGWPWDRPDPVHPRDAGRFAVHVDGRHETPPAK